MYEWFLRVATPEDLEKSVNLKLVRIKTEKLYSSRGIIIVQPNQKQ